MTVDPDATRHRAARHLALVLDVPELDAAVAYAAAVDEFFTVAKVGLELFTAAGPSAIDAFVARGLDVFADLKLHDIPNTVGSAARVVGERGATYLTVHTAGGHDMLRRGVDGFAEGSAGRRPHGGVLGVTVLTSDAEASDAVLTRRVALARDTGCRGVICAAPDLPVVRAEWPEALTVVPGIRLPDSERDDQRRIATPGRAVADGADLLVIGRTVSAAPDPHAAARRVADDVAGVMV